MPSYAWPVPLALTGHVTSIVGYDYELDPAAIHHGLPSTSVTVIIAFDEPLDCGWLGSGRSDRYWLLAGGLHTRPVLIHTHGRQHGIQLGLTPLGCAGLLGVPAGAIGNQILTHTDLDGGLSSALHAQLADASWRTRFRLLEGWLSSRLGRETAPAAEVAEAWRVVCALHGDVRIDDLARHVGWSRRHLASRFTAWAGVGPKQAARLARFEYARSLLDAGRPLVDVAVASRFADQAHLNREWRALAGQTPSQMREEFPIVQDTPC